MSLTVVTALCHGSRAGCENSVCLSYVSVVCECVENLCYRTSRVGPYTSRAKGRERRAAAAEPPKRLPSASDRQEAQGAKGQGQRSMLHGPGAIPAKSVSAEPYLETVVW